MFLPEPNACSTAAYAVCDAPLPSKCGASASIAVDVAVAPAAPTLTGVKVRPPLEVLNTPDAVCAKAVPSFTKLGERYMFGGPAMGPAPFRMASLLHDKWASHVSTAGRPVFGSIPPRSAAGFEPPVGKLGARPNVASLIAPPEPLTFCDWAPRST